MRGLGGRFSGLRRRARSVARRVLRRRPPERPGKHRPQYVVVVSYGRSGSTLVQGLLNAMPRAVVRGENGLYLVPLFRAYDGVRDFRKLHLPHNPHAEHSAFYGLHEVRPRTFVRSARALVHRHVLAGHRIEDVDLAGFKEVAWHRLRDDEVGRFFDYLDLVLPGCRYVLTQRNLADVATSGFWKEHDPKVVTNKVRRVERIHEHLRTTRPDRVHDVRYEELTSADQTVRDATLTALAEAVVGHCDQQLLATLRATSEQGHGPFPFGASRVEGRAGSRARRER